MTAARTSTSDRAQGLRALTAVLALYALVLQTLLGGIAALPTGPGHGILCLQQADGDLDTSGNGSAPHHHHAACCTAAPAVAALAAPSPDVTMIAWPERRLERLAWTSEPAFGARAPPGTRPSPRGPPVV